jgi:hypothetical protein
MILSRIKDEGVELYFLPHRHKHDMPAGGAWRHVEGAKRQYDRLARGEEPIDFFEMSAAELKVMLRTCRSTTFMRLRGVVPPSAHITQAYASLLGRMNGSGPYLAANIVNNLDGKGVLDLIIEGELKPAIEAARLFTTVRWKLPGKEGELGNNLDKVVEAMLAVLPEA